MRRVSVLAAAAGLALVAIAPAQAGYYVIRWDNTGICQIWSEELQHKPLEWPSHYQVMSKPVRTLGAAMVIQAAMREQRRCFL